MAATMKTALLAFAAAVPVLAAGDGHGGGDPNLHYKLVNFAILAAGVVLLFVKVLFPLFRKQQKEILAGLQAAELKAAEAAEQAAEIDKRLAGLEGDIANLKAKAGQEMTAEAQRFEKETEAQLAKVEGAAGVEIASAVKAARQDLKAFAAELAVDLARKKIVAGMDDSVQAALVARFAGGLQERVVEKN